MRAVVEDISANKMKLWGIGKRRKTLIALSKKLCRLLKVLVSVESMGGFRFRFDFVQWVKVITHLKRINALIPLIDQNVGHRKNTGVTATGISDLFHPGVAFQGVAGVDGFFLTGVFKLQLVSTLLRERVQSKTQGHIQEKIRRKRNL